MKKIRIVLNILIWSFLVGLISCNGSGGNEAVDEFLGNTNSDDNGNSVGNSALSFTPSTYDYGDIGLGGSAQAVFVVTNTSAQTVFLSNFSGENAFFSVSSTTCQLSGGAIFPGQTCNVTIDFNAISGGDQSINLNLNYGTSASLSNLITYLSLEGSAGINPPTGYQLDDVTGTTATISWSDNSTNEVSFEVSRCDGVVCATTFTSAFTDFLAPNVTSYQFTGLTEGAYYRYRVRAVSASSQSTWLEGTTMITFGGVNSIIDNGAGTVDLTSVDCRTANEGTYISLDWNAVADATAYFIYDTSGGGNVLITTVAAPTTSTILTGLNVNTAYKLLITVATTAGYNSQNTATSDLTTTNYVPCMVLGKATPNDANTKNGFLFPASVMAYGSKFFLADRDNHRVLIWNSLPNGNTDVPDVVIGQSAFGERYINNTPSNIGTVSEQSLNTPYAVWAGSVGGTDKMVVADYSNNRVLIWNSIPTTNHQAADVVVGQGNFSTSINDGGDITRGLQGPIDVWSDGARLYVSDYSNHRVLIWNTFPTANFAIPDVYLGQDTNSGQGNTCGTANRMKNPRGVWSDGTRVLVANGGCNRVSIYEAVPGTGTNPAPDTILGQSSLTASGSGNAADEVNSPMNPRIYGGKIFVADYNNNRIKIWNAIPAPGAHGAASNNVIGFSNTAGNNGLTQSRLQNPMSVTVSGTKTYVADYNNHRIMGYNTVPAADSTNADFLIGQYDYTVEVLNDHNTIAGNNFDEPEGIAYDGTQFFVSDPSRHRVLVWDGIPTSWNQTADYVLGQSNMASMNSARNQSQLNTPRGICVAGGKLWVPDFGNRRVMVFDLPISSNGPNAVGVLGQTAWTTNTTGTGKDRVNQAIRCFYDGSKFYVTDYQYDRVLIWNSLPVLTNVTDNPSADVIVGTNTANQTTQIGLRDPRGVYSDGSKLFIADAYNNRVMVWDPIPTIDDTPASFLLGGNPNWTSTTAGTSSVLLDYPVDIVGDGAGKIYVLDRDNGRIMVFDNPTSDNEPATEMYGKVNYTNNTEPGDNSQVISSAAYSMFLNGTQLFFGDSQHSRVLGFPVAP